MLVKEQVFLLKHSKTLLYFSDVFDWNLSLLIKFSLANSGWNLDLIMSQTFFARQELLIFREYFHPISYTPNVPLSRDSPIGCWYKSLPGVNLEIWTRKTEKFCFSKQILFACNIALRCKFIALPYFFYIIFILKRCFNILPNFYLIFYLYYGFNLYQNFRDIFWAFQ